MKLNIDVLIYDADEGQLVLRTLETAVFSVKKRRLADGTFDRQRVDVEAFIGPQWRDKISVPDSMPDYWWKRKDTLRTVAHIKGNGKSLAPFFASHRTRWCIGSTRSLH